MTEIARVRDKDRGFTGRNERELRRDGGRAAAVGGGLAHLRRRAWLS